MNDKQVYPAALKVQPIMRGEADDREEFLYPCELDRMFMSYLCSCSVGEAA